MSQFESPGLSPIEYWHSLLRPDVELTNPFFADLAARMREKRLTFGDRIHCPFLRPFFLDPDDEERIRVVAETVAALGERVARAALDRSDLLDAVALTDAERSLVSIDPRYATASTASRLDAFLLPDTIQCAEYNAESPAGLGYAETLARLFDALPIMERFRKQYATATYPLMDRMREALLASYREWGGTAAPPAVAIVDWRGVPTWSEFEILQERFIAAGLPTIVCDPVELDFDGTRLWASGTRVDLVYRRVLLNDIVARPSECRALVAAYAAGAVCLANSFRCKIPHKKAFFGVLTDERYATMFDDTEREVIARHVPWTRRVREGSTTWHGNAIDLVPHIRANRSQLVLKPNDEYGGSGVTLGWECDEQTWDTVLARALQTDDPKDAWIVQERIQVRREIFPRFQEGAGASMTDMLVDFAPYLFRGRLAGFLTRLSATGLANVTSGGGQVPAFIVD